MIPKRVSRAALTLFLAAGPVLGATTHAWAEGNGNGNGNGQGNGQGNGNGGSTGDAQAELPVGTLGGVGLAGVLSVALVTRKGIRRAVVRIRNSA